MNQSKEEELKFKKQSAFFYNLLPNKSIEIIMLTTAGILRKVKKLIFLTFDHK